MSRRHARAARPSRTAGPFALHAPAGVSDAARRRFVRLAWALAALLAAALLAVTFGPHRIGDYFTETDFYGQYAEGARLIQNGRLLPARYGVVGPGYEAALALAGLVVRDLFLAAQLLSIAATAATLLLWFHLLERRAAARLALCAALFLAFDATFFRYGYSATTDALALALQAAALYALLARSSGRAALAAGLFAALAFLTRYNAAVLLPAGIVAALAGGTPHPRRARAALLFAAGFLAPVAPWALWSLAHGGSFASQLHHNIAYEVFARAKGIPWDDYQRDLQPQFHGLWDVIRRDPGAVAARMLHNVGDHLRQDAASLLGWPATLCALAGLVLGAADGTLRRLWPLGLAWALLFLALVPVFYSERYSLALLPTYAALAGLAFASPRFALVAGRARRVWLKGALVLLPLGAMATASWRVQARAMDQLPVEALECAETLRALKRPGDAVIARKPNLAFHAGVRAVPFPFTNGLPALADYARESGARWLYFSWPEGETRPQYWFLLDTTAAVPGLAPRRATAPHPAVLYEIGPDFGRVPAWMANDTLMALHTLRARLMVDGNDVRVLHDFARVEHARGRLEPARGALERAAALAPGDVAVLVALGEVALKQGDAATGEAAFARAQALAPASVEARVGRGWARLVAGRPEEAAALWRPVVSETRDAATLLRMAEIFHALGDREAAAAARATLARLGVRP